MSSTIHPSAVIDPKASIGRGVTIGPFSLIGPEVTLEDGVELKSHVVVEGRTRVGEGTVIYPFATIGHAPQDLKYGGEPSSIRIGKKVSIREYVTIHPGTKGDRMETVIGDHCLFMVGAHVAHDCIVGNHVILANNATLAGHVVVEDHVIIGGLSAVHQFVRIGKHAIIGGMSGIENDVIPYGMAMGERAHLNGLNLVGLKRRGFSRDAIQQLRRAFDTLFAEEEGTFATRVAKLATDYAAMPEVMEVVHFLQAQSDRAVCQPKAAR